MGSTRHPDDFGPPPDLSPPYEGGALRVEASIAGVIQSLLAQID
ncbi:hypothetical protein [Microbacterium sp. CH12i]|nr:hypothetical protein [Microbacterium sp. CH12i]